MQAQRAPRIDVNRYILSFAYISQTVTLRRQPSMAAQGPIPLGPPRTCWTSPYGKGPKGHSINIHLTLAISIHAGRG